MICSIHLWHCMATGLGLAKLAREYMLPYLLKEANEGGEAHWKQR